MGKIIDKLYTKYDEISYKLLGSYTPDSQMLEHKTERDTVNSMYELFFEKGCKPGLELKEKTKTLRK